jgi:glycine betaine/proline transport system substrate-binding protein
MHMKLNRTMRRTGLAAGLLALGLSAAACGSDDGGDTASDGGGGGEGGGGTVTLGIIPSWTDGLSTAYLWEHVLTEEGYEVEIEEIADAAPLYTGVANGDIDVYPSAWSEVTHEAYMDEYGDDLEDLGAYYEGAKLTLAVPEYTDISSIADLKGNEDMFDSKIVGIEAGAGLTKATKEQVIPTYGLDDYTLVESSTTAMLAELKKATEAEEDIVVTLWKPFWANSEFPVKDLEDPEGALGEPEALHAIATKGFSEEMPEVAEMMGNFKLDDEQYGSLENMVVNEYGEGKEAEAIDAWIEQNPDFMESLKG